MSQLVVSGGITNFIVVFYVTELKVALVQIAFKKCGYLRNKIRSLHIPRICTKLVLLSRLH